MRSLLALASILALTAATGPSPAAGPPTGAVVGQVIAEMHDGVLDSSTHINFVGHFKFGSKAWHGMVTGVIRTHVDNDGMTVFPFTLRGASVIDGKPLRIDCTWLDRADGLSVVPDPISQFFIAGTYTDSATCVGRVAGVSARRRLSWEFVWEFLLTGCTYNPCTVRTRFAGIFRQ